MRVRRSPWLVVADVEGRTPNNMPGMENRAEEVKTKGLEVEALGVNPLPATAWGRGRGTVVAGGEVPWADPVALPSPTASCIKTGGNIQLSGP